eukprot:GILI01022077.1.p1 GENE.GILI01022077.1~~GILI01022077.1.p1  ORF type:complete len:1035 (-),score=83.20 GILI01022077.1:44-2698(-)
MITKIEFTGHPKLMDMYIGVRREALKRLQIGIDSGVISFATELPLVRFLGVSMGSKGFPEDEKLAALVLKIVLASFRRQTVGPDIFIRSAAEVEALFNRFANVDEIATLRKTFFTLVLSTTSSAIKNKLLGSSDAFRLLRAFPVNGRSKNRESLLSEEQPLPPPKDPLSHALHADIMKLFGEVEFSDTDFTPLSVALDALAAVHKSLWRAFFKSLINPFVIAIRTATMEQKRYYFEVLAKVVSAHGSRRNSVPWALSEFLHSHSVEPSDLAIVLNTVKDRNFNSVTLGKLNSSVPAMPLSNLLMLSSISALSEKRSSSLIHIYITERLLENKLGILASKANDVPNLPFLKHKLKKVSRYLDLSPSLPTVKGKTKEWASHLVQSEKFKEKVIAENLNKVSFEQLAKTLTLSTTQVGVYDRPSDKFYTSAADAGTFAELGLDKLSASDTELRTIFEQSESALLTNRSHTSALRRLSVWSVLNSTLPLVMLWYPEEIRAIRVTAGDGTAVTDGWLQILSACSADSVIFLESNPATPTELSRQRAVAVASLNKASQSKPKLDAWISAHKQLYSNSNEIFNVKTSWLQSTRAFEAVKRSVIEERYGSIALCPQFLPHFRRVAQEEIKAFPTLVKKGKITSFNIHTLVKASELLNGELLKPCIASWRAVPIKNRHRIGVSGLAEMLSVASEQTDGRYDYIRAACIEHLLTSSDESFSRSISTASDIASFFENCEALLRTETELQRRIIGRLEVVLPHTNYSGLRSILKGFAALAPTAFADEMRLIMSRIPLYVCNDVSQFNGRELIDLCIKLNNSKLMARSTLDAIIERVTSTDPTDDDKWIPTTFEGTLSESGNDAFTKERARVTSILKGMVVTNQHDNDSPSMDETIE